MGYEIRHRNSHVEVYLDGVFQFSADTLAEAYREIEGQPFTMYAVNGRFI